MKKLRVILIVLLALMLLPAAVSAQSAGPQTFVAHLSGANEVPARDTLARGTAVLQFNADATQLRYMLIVANIDNAFASHIHCAPAGTNGPVGLTLYVGAPAGGRFDGVLASAVKTAPDAGNACGWTSLQDVITAIESGNAYVNVHTNDGVAPPNTGPGDFPGGEIRGQVQ